MFQILRLRHPNKVTMSLKRKRSDIVGEASFATRPKWTNGLLSAMQDPELKVFQDEQITIIKDKYPKAMYHYLVLPNRTDISTIRQLKREHIDLLNHMEKTGRNYMQTNHPDLEYRAGYHAVPSMAQLHLHVITQDFISDSLKTKKHWNSFTTPYFVDSETIIQQLEKNGRVTILDPKEAENLLKRPLKCHRCGEVPSNIPALKKHLLVHCKTMNK